MTINPYQEPVQQPQETSAWSIVSLIGGIASFTILPFLGSIAALVAGYAAKKEIRESNGRLTGDGLATAGLIMGWVNVALGVLAACLVVLMLTGVIGSLAICGPMGQWIEGMR